MRVLRGRLKAVLLAGMATLILIGVLAPSTTIAGDPPGLGRFMVAIGTIESHGSYTAHNSSSGAYGKYQITPYMWRVWASRYLGNPYAKPTPANQEALASAKFRSLYWRLGSWRRVAYYWLTGTERRYGWSTTATRYVNRVMGVYYGLPANTAIPKAPSASPTSNPTTASSTVRHVGDGSSAIAYSGTWKQASYGAYSGGSVHYSTAAGASAKLTFTGKGVTWFGPVGPTRGSARISVDGKVVATVNLYRSSFAARNALFHTTVTAGTHTLTVTVVGTSGHPMVAIDEFTVID